MLFNSYEFIFMFLPTCIIGYYFLNNIRYAIAEYFLVGMSLFFYAYFNPSYLWIILASILGNYLLTYCMRMVSFRYIRKALLIIGVISNVGILFYYKYMGFFVETLNYIFKKDYNVVNILLPLGISFFTFQQLSYVIDCYKGTVPAYTFRQYALFVTFFPQLIAGPIVLHNEVIPQFENVEKKKFNWENFSLGLMAFSFGMAKKVLIADSFGIVVNNGFSDITSLGTVSAIIVAFCYTIQIYFDFSGYCDMATGIGKMFNIEIPMNFNSPYKSLSITEFWKRWHMTLTRFLRTYVYFPLGGNRKGKVRTYVNLFIVFLVSGIWHGANYTFIVWGIFHGLIMVFERIFKVQIEKIPHLIRWGGTFVLINLSWIIFRANNLNDVILFMKEIVTFKCSLISLEFDNVFLQVLNLLPFTTPMIANKVYPFVLMLLVLGIIIFCKNTNERLDKFKPSVINAFFGGLLLILSTMSLSGESTFLYFNF